MKRLIAACSLLLLLSMSVFGGEGHSHGPGQVQPTKGGVIMKGEKFFLEVVGTQNEVRFYPLKPESATGHALKPIALTDVKLTANFKLPRGAKNEALKLVAAGDHFVAKISAKGSHRYEVEASIETLGEKEKLTYQIEPQE